MHFLLYSRVDERNIRNALGAPEYSYYFLLKEFRPALERLGSVEIIAELDDARRIHAGYSARGEACVLVAFTAPHQLPPDLGCPVVPVFAWEFDRIPDEAWGGEPRNDWRLPLREYGQALTLSDYAVAAARRAVGDDFPLVALPVPLWERMEPVRQLCTHPRSAADDAILVDGAVLDVRDYRHSATSMRSLSWRVTHATGVWTGEEFALDFRLGSADVGSLIGFYLAEPWGSWSRNTEVWVTLPRLLWGEVEIVIEGRAYGDNVGRALLAGMNDDYRVMRFGPQLQTCVLVFDLSAPTHVLSIRGMETSHPPGGRDERTLGIGIAGLRIRRVGGGSRHLQLQPDLQPGPTEPAIVDAPTAGQQDFPGDRSAACCWSGCEFALDFRPGSPDLGALMGFYPADTWGSWSRNTEVWILLPYLLRGKVEIVIEARAYGENVGRALLAGFNDDFQSLRFGPELGTCTLDFDLSDPCHVLCIRGLETGHVAGGSDDRTLGIGIAGLRVRQTHVGSQRLDLQQGRADPGLLNGFWEMERWGTWSASEAPWVLLPRPVDGTVRLRIDAMAWGASAGRPLQLYLGGQSQPLVLGSDLAQHEFEFHLDEPAQALGVTGAVLTRVAQDGDPRSFSIGLRSIEILEAEVPEVRQVPVVPTPLHARHIARLEGAVFTSVLNPRDDRKNWQLLITAFCAAFADRDDVTLALKMTHHSQSSYLFDFHYHVLQRLPPFRCRVVLLHGFLADEDYARLIRRTDFYVNASRAEGLCIPLMEFMSCGKPAIAPRHTSMLDYLDDGNSFEVTASTEPCSWPHDERLVLRALQYRIDASSLVDAFLRARRLLHEDPATYARMGAAAREGMQRYCSMQRVQQELDEFMQGVVRRAGGGTHG